MFSIACYEFLGVLFLVRGIFGEDGDACSLLLNHLPKSPLILKENEIPTLLYPNEHNIIKLPNLKHIRISCTDTRFENFSDRSQIQLGCVNGNFKMIPDKFECCDYLQIWEINRPKFIHGKIELDKFECREFPSPVIKNAGTCFDNNKLLDIGYETGKHFLPILSVCFDQHSGTSLYSFYNTSMIYLGHQDKIRRRSYIKSKYLGYSVDDVYDTSCRRIVHKLLAEDKESYLKDISFYDVVPIQLTPKDDFLFGIEQQATFVDVNSAPIWRILKETSWARLESEIRNMLMSSKGEYGVATGVYGVLRFEQGRTQTPVYLNGSNKLSMPKFLWKIIFNKNHKSGIVLVSLNNPFVKTPSKSDILCTNICDEIDWIKSKDGRISVGLTYCSEMNEFLKATGFDNMFW